MQQRTDQQGSGQDAVKVGVAARMRMQRSGAADAPRVNVELPEVIAITARLAQVLAQEVDYLDNMQIKKIEELQDEKRRLTRSLMIMQRELDRRPEIKDAFDAEEVEALRKVTEIFNHVLQDNRRKLLVAKELNGRVVQAISDVVSEKNARAGYNKRGIHGQFKEAPPSVTLNETI